MTHLKILHIITRLTTGGSSEAVLDLCHRLNPARYTTILLYGSKNTGIFRQEEYDISFVKNQHRIKYLVRNISPVKDAIAFFVILKWIIKEKPDIVHTHTSKAGILGRWAAFIARSLRFVRRDMKIIHTPHGHIFYGYYPTLWTRFFILAEKLTSHLTDCFVALTEGEKNETIKIAGISSPDIRWEIIPSGISISPESGINTAPPTKSAVLKEFGIPSDSIIVGTVARLEPVKGVYYFVKSAALVLEKISYGFPHLRNKIYFLIVGDGSLREELEKIAASTSTPTGTREEEHTHRIIFTGMRDDVRRLISAMDIYVQPSLNEGMGKTIAEAMSLAKPVVATNVQGIPDLVKDGITGILVPPSDEKAISEAVAELISALDTAGTLGENARRFVTEKIDGYPRFSVERMIHLHEKLYDEITS